MAAERLTDEELTALEDRLQGRGPEAWSFAWSKLESLVAEVRASRKFLAAVVHDAIGFDAWCRWCDRTLTTQRHADECIFGKAERYVEGQP